MPESVLPDVLHPSSEGAPTGAMHLPDELQTFGATQSFTETHPVLHPKAHLYGEHSCGGPVNGCAVSSSMHVVPLMHLPASHEKPSRHSALDAHDVLQTVASAQLRLLHDTAAPATQSPRPLQPKVVCELLLHIEAQTVLESANAQAFGFVPRQEPPQSPPAPAHALRGGCGSPVIVVHSPAFPTTLHAWH